MKKYWAGKYKIADKMGAKYQDDLWDQLPTLDAFLELRKNPEAYKFFFCVFGPAVYGTSFTKHVFAPSKTWADALAAFTESDEAWALFVLEDNWNKWRQASLMEFEKEARSMNLSVDWDEAESEAGSSITSTEEMDIVDYHENIVRHKVLKKMVITQQYSDGGMNGEAHDHLEKLEEMVGEDRELYGEAFYLKVKAEVLKSGLMGDDMRMMIKPIRKKLRMK